MKNKNSRFIFWRILFVIALPIILFGQSRMLDDFETLSGWKGIGSQGARVDIKSGEGKNGNAMVIDFDVTSGYIAAEKEFDVDLPPYYQFTFDMKADIPINNFEFKLIDEKENVFWIKKFDFRFPKQWQLQKIKKRHITFAWGPSGGGEIRKVKKINFVLSTGAGGKGQIYIDNFRFEPIDTAKVAKTKATVKFSSTKKGVKPQIDNKGNSIASWISAGKKQNETISIDFNYKREIGGVVIDWDSAQYATAYTVDLSEDGKQWDRSYAVTNGNGGRDYIFLPEKDLRILRINLEKSNAGKSYSIKHLQVKEPEFSAQRTDFFSALAAEQRKGLFPKYLLKQQSFWTVVGVSGDTKESLINEQGTVEVDKESFSLEPFLYINGKLITWNDVELTQSLMDRYLPIPSVEWKFGVWKLTITPCAYGVAGKSQVIVRYRLENSSGLGSSKGKLFVAIRPFQVNPPWQWVNTLGGVSRIDSVKVENGMIMVDSRMIIPVSTPTAFGATTFDNGDITEHLQQGKVPQNVAAVDRNGFVSAAIEYDVDVESGIAQDFYVAYPLHQWQGSPKPAMGWKSTLYGELALSATKNSWHEKLDNVKIYLPASAQPIINTIKSNLAYILINRDGPGIQPGSRNYERSWIRDGSLTSTALLELGMTDEVRQYIDWYAKYQLPNGKIPCVVDTRGADPLDEHDSPGEFIYAVKTYFNFVHDTVWLRTKFDPIVKAVRYMQGLRAQRKTEVYKNGAPEQRACYGIVPESISHEGYWDHPRHSYWDDFFVMRGLKDATDIAHILGEKKLADEFANERDDFKKDFYASVRLAMQIKNIDYIPGCVELGDFDATSTTIGINPANELGNIPEPQLHNTFDKYYQFLVDRKENNVKWESYTPYENRTIGSFIYLDQKERALDAINFFMSDRRPAGWNHWAEVVWKDSSTPKYIGDMPHTWVGSDFIRSVRAMFVYEREQDTSLVIGAGIPEEWAKDSAGVSVMNMATYYGKLTYSIHQQGDSVSVALSGDVKIPSGKIVVQSPSAKKIRRVLIDGTPASTFNDKQVMVTKLSAKIIIFY